MGNVAKPGLGDAAVSAASLVSKITGFGDYTVRKNSMSTMVLGGSIPQFIDSRHGVRIKKCEFIANIAGTTSFTNDAQYPIQPGNSTTFPWLSQVAQCFEQYKMHGLVFIYRPTSGSIASSSTASAALGVVVFATNYDVLDANFASKKEMEDYEFSCSTVPFAEMLHPVECDRRQTTCDTLYIRTGAVPTGADQRLYDLGLFQVGTDGMQAAYTVGELWASYDVELFKPKLPPT